MDGARNWQPKLKSSQQVFLLRMNFIVTDGMLDVVVLGGVLMGVAAACFIAVSAAQRRKHRRKKERRNIKTGKRRP